MSSEHQNYVLQEKTLDWGPGVEVRVFEIPRSRSANSLPPERKKRYIRLEKHQQLPQAPQVSIKEFTAGYKASLQQLHAPLPPSDSLAVRMRRVFGSRHGRQPSNA